MPATTPWKVKDLLHRCLQKDPKERLHDIADARIEIQEQIKSPSEPLRTSPRTRHSTLAIVGVAAVCMAFLLGALAMRHFTHGAPQTSPPVARSSVRLEPGHWLTGVRWSPPFGIEHPTRTAMVISSDGRFLIYCAIKEDPATNDQSQLFLRKLDQLDAKPIAGTEGGMSPFLSPDNRWVGFVAGGKLMKVPVEGGLASALCDVTGCYGVSWGADNEIVFAPQVDSGLWRVSAAAGEVERLTAPDPSREEFGHRLPSCLPAGKGILFTVMRHPWDPHPRVAVLEPGTRKWRVLLEDAADARYVPAGHLAFLRQGKLLLVPFDLDRLQVTPGQQVPAVDGIAQALNIGYYGWHTAAGQYSVSASGSLIYAAGGVLLDSQNSLVWVDFQGKAQPVTPSTAPFTAPRVSPDGRRIAYSTKGSEVTLWVYDLDRGTAVRVNSEGNAGMPVWSPDGQQLAFGWFRTGVRNLYRQGAEGITPMERLTKSEHHQAPGSWAPDGQLLAFVQEDPNDSDILVLNLRDRKITPLFNSKFFEGFPDFSPDGKWIAYVSSETGRREVYVQSFPPGEVKKQISNGGGTEPLWARDGARLFYRSTAPEHRTVNSFYTTLDQVWVVEIQTVPEFSPGKPKLLFEQPGYAASNPVRNWDISPDGKRFLMVKLEERKPQPLTEMVLVQNWFEELRRLAPPNK